MIFGELPLAEAEGAMLAHAVAVGGARLPKGLVVDAAVLAAAAAAGLAGLWVARLEPGDVPEADAATRIADALCGPGVTLRAPVHGRVNLHAAAGGLFLPDPGRIARANGATDAVAIATLPSHTPVGAGELVATVKIIPYALGADELAAVLAAARCEADGSAADGGAAEVRPWRAGLVATLVQTRLPETPAKLLAKTAEVTRARLDRLGIALHEAPVVPHGISDLADALRAAGGDLLLVAGATATSDRRDVIPAALEAAGGAVLRVGMPADPGNLLVLGRLGDATVIGLPGCARSPKRNGLDLVLELLAAGLPATAEGLSRMGVGGLLEESGRPVPWGWAG
jgi:molybdenum cofactor cytidylyltransferase